MDLRWGNHRAANTVFEVWSMGFDIIVIGTFSLTEMYALAAPLILAWSEKEAIPSIMGYPLHLCSQTHSTNAGRFPTCCLWVLLQLPGAAPSFPTRCARNSQEFHIARILPVSSGSTFARKSVFAMLEGLILGRVFSLGPANRQNCYSLGGNGASGYSFCDFAQWFPAR